MHHSLKATRENLNGHFSRDLAPVLTIDPGDRVTFECLDANWGLEPHNGTDIDRRTVQRRPDGLDAGHALTGPVFVRGAKPGLTLKVSIESLALGGWGTTYVGGWPSEWNAKLGVESEGAILCWEFDSDGKVATNQFGDRIALSPFMGVYGMPTDVPGLQSTIPPRRTGGNLDCKELGVGSVLYLPIEVEGGLFSTGDGHAVQGDGEVCITAIEAAVEAVTLAFDVVSDMPLPRPVAETPSGWVGLGFGSTLDEAMLDAIETMVELLGWKFGLDRVRAIGFCSLAVDFRVTQVVNGTVGVHGVLPHGKLKLG
ncbi:MAG: acetamidase/formamidase family protein [Armatimonadetes bacterium]|nr:acetamidase/formamidase family protein [Armatimonadota bacterium]